MNTQRNHGRAARFWALGASVLLCSLLLACASETPSDQRRDGGHQDSAPSDSRDDLAGQPADDGAATRDTQTGDGAHLGDDAASDTAPLGDPANECADWARTHPQWVLCDDFESGQLNRATWNDVSGDNRVVTDTAYGGTRALAMHHPGGATGGYMNSIWYPRGYTSLHDHGYQHLFLRWYSRFSDSFSSSTKVAGFTVKASNLDSFWDGNRGAGYKPDGVTSGGGTRVVTSLQDGEAPGHVRFYTYHRKMMVSRWTDGNDQLQCRYYGNHRPPPATWQQTPSAFDGADDYYCSPPGTAPWNAYTTLRAEDSGTYLQEDLALSKQSWRCIELEMAVNTPGQDDGVLRMWLENELVAQWTGARFAEAGAQMAIHALQLTASSPSDHGAQISYYDNVVVSTERIGCF